MVGESPDGAREVFDVQLFSLTLRPLCLNTARFKQWGRACLGCTCTQGLSALPSLLGHAPHRSPAHIVWILWHLWLRAMMQAGGFGCSELFQDGSEVFLHPG